MFNGAAYIYEKYVRQYIKNIGSYRSSNYPDEYKKVLHMMTFDARNAVERYIDRHGPDAFERVIRAVYIYICGAKTELLHYKAHLSVFLTFVSNFYMCRLKKKQRSTEYRFGQFWNEKNVNMLQSILLLCTFST